jgi:hypothetical protein
MGTIKCGFWTFKFIITPNEFETFLNECDAYNIKFILPVYGYPQHNKKQVLDNYEKFYISFAHTAKQQYSSFVYEMHIQGKNGLTSFHIRNEDIMFLFNHRQWAKDKIYYLMMSYPKSYAVTCEDDKEHFIYEDILKREPDIYPIFLKLTNSIKSFTKPFRFINKSNETIQEIKPSGVRISENAANSLSLSFIFTQYNLKMKSFTK